MKILMLCLFLFSSATISFVQKDCLLEFQIAIQTADEAGTADFKICEEAWDESMCNREVIRAHEQSVTDAANQYDICVRTN